MASASLVLHCGARQVTEQELATVPCPAPQGRWRPVPHVEVLRHASGALIDAGYAIEKQQLGLTRDDARFFGTLTLTSSLAAGVSLAVGVRSSTDKSLSLGFAYGSRVFACDNLAFRSDKVIARKHTTFGIDRFQEQICKAVSELADFKTLEGERIRRMQYRDLSDEAAESFLLQAYQDLKILSPRTLPTALKEWRSPSFPEFAEHKNVWRVYNAITYAISDRAKASPEAHRAATIRLGGLLSDEAPQAALHAPQSA